MERRVRALVSHASSELGTEIASAFASRGWELVLTDPDRFDLERTSAVLRRRFPNAHIITQLVLDGNIGHVIELFTNIDAAGGVN
ncbi:hypothetical protein HDU93_005656, partial [Gonapodya sp. JEL0774]